MLNLFSKPSKSIFGHSCQDFKRILNIGFELNIVDSKPVIRNTAKTGRYVLLFQVACKRGPANANRASMNDIKTLCRK